MNTGEVIGGAVLLAVAIWVFTIMPAQDLTPSILAGQFQAFLH